MMSSHQNTQKRNHSNTVPLNIAANDITFSNNYNNMKRFGQGPSTTSGTGMYGINKQNFPS